MQITLDKLITRDAITDGEREKAIALESQYLKFEDEISKYSASSASRQIKAWRAEVEEHPERADKLAKKMSTYADEAITLRRAAKTKRSIFIENYMDYVNYP